MNRSQLLSCENVIAVADEPHHRLVIEKDCVRAYAVEIGPGQSTLCHLHASPYLLYVAGESHTISAAKEGESEYHYPDEHCEFSPAGLQHVVENVAETPFRNLIFEVLPAASNSRRPGLPFANAAGVRSSTLYSGDDICAQLIQLNSGAQTQVTGPAVVASPYENEIEVISSEQGARKLNKFDQLEFIAEGTTGLIRCESGSPARVVLVFLGCQ